MEPLTVEAMASALSSPSKLVLASYAPSILHSHGLRLHSSPLLRLDAVSRAPLRLTKVVIKAVALPVITFEGSLAGNVDLDLKCARPETARAVVHRGVITELQNKRRGTASTLTRGEVRGGGRKPYPQKKTGRARRGSQRTPLRPGGGVIFGPKPKDWRIKMNRKEKRLAISTALQRAAKSFIVVEDFEEWFSEPKTKVFIDAMKRWGANPSIPNLLFTMNATENLVKSSRNIGSLKLLTPRNLNLHDVLKAKRLIFTKSGVAYLNNRYSVNLKSSGEDEEEKDGEEDDVEDVNDRDDGEESREPKNF